MVTDTLTWFVGLIQTSISWLGSMMLAPGVSILAFLAGIFIVGFLIDALLFKGAR